MATNQYLMADATPSLAPIKVHSLIAPSSWMDYNGHMNAAAYAGAFDQALDAFLVSMDLGRDYVKTQDSSLFTVQNHITYQREVCQDDALSIFLQLVNLDEKRMHVFLRMINETTGMQAAVSEVLSLHVDMATRRSCPFPQPIFDQLNKLLQTHKQLSTPVELGQRIAIKNRSR